MKISIIVPVHNCENYVGVSIESVQNQTYPNWELILVDDGSTDNSYKICHNYAEKDQRIKVIQSENFGPASARNIGLKNATGEYCLFMDSDDYLEFTALFILRGTVQLYEPELVIYPYFTDKLKNGTYEVVKNNALKELVIDNNQEFVKQYRELADQGFTHPVWNKLYSKKFLDDCHVFFSEGINVSEDFLFNIKLYKNLKKAVLIEQPLYHYVSRQSGSITSSFNQNRFHSSKEVFLQSQDAFMNWNQSELKYVRNSFITDLNICINNLFNYDCPWRYKQRYKYIHKIVNDQSVVECIKTTQLEGLRNKITGFLIQHKFVSLLIFMGKITRMVGEARAKWRVP